MMKENQSEKRIYITFIIVGFVLLIFGIILSSIVFSKKGKVETIGIISRIVRSYGNDDSTEYNVFVTYEVEGKVYESKLDAYASSFYEGKEIPIYYMENNVQQIGSLSFNALILIFPGVGLIFFISGLIKILKDKRGMSKKEKLKQTGQRIDAQIQEIMRNTSYAVNNRNPYMIICRWYNPADQKSYLFKSQNLWQNPADLIQEKNIQTLPVYYNPNKIKEYVVDLDEITESVVDLT